MATASQTIAAWNAPACGLSCDLCDHEPDVVVTRNLPSRARWERQAQRLRIAEAEAELFTDAPDCY